MTETSNSNPASSETNNEDEPDKITTDSSTDCSKSKKYLKGMLNKLIKVILSDGRILIGVFLCTDKESNVILGSCAEYVMQQRINENQQNDNSDPGDEIESEIDPTLNIEPRILGLAMVPGKHIMSIHLDDTSSYTSSSKTPVSSPITDRRLDMIQEGTQKNSTNGNMGIQLEAATEKI